MNKPSKIVLLFATLLLLPVISFVRPQGLEAAEKIRVAASIAPVKFLLERLGKEHLDILILVDKGADPHSYEPKPGQLKNIHDSELYFSIGLPFEEIWTARFKELSPKLRLVDLGQDVKHLELELGHASHEVHSHAEDSADKGGSEAEHNHEAEDPHLWSSPANMKIMAHTAAEALISVRPELADEIKSNLAALNTEIDGIDAKIRELLSQLPPDKKAFMVFHPAWAYYARDYGLRELAVEQEGREPGPRKLKQLAEAAAEAKAGLMVVQPQFSMRMAESLASSLYMKVVTLDPLSEDWPGAMLGLAQAMVDTYATGNPVLDQSGKN